MRWSFKVPGGRTPGTIDVRRGPPNDGYLSMASFYAPIACSGSCDDRTFTGSIPEGILFNNAIHTSITMSTNGFMQLGTGSNAAPLNLRLPTASAPANTLAPFWTDLHPAGTDGLGSGKLYVGYITVASGRTWLVVEWNNVVQKNGTAKHNFQVWLRLGGTVEDITFTYDKLESNGTSGLLTIGAQNSTGSAGESYYYNSVGTIPATGINGDLIAASPGPSPGGTRTISFQGKGTAVGAWTNCGVLVNSADPAAPGISCVSGSVN